MVQRYLRVALLLFTCLIAFRGEAQTSLQPGDIVFVGFNGTDPDDFAFAPLVDLAAGTQLKFTDNGWYSAGGFRSTEGIATYTAPAGGVAKGTIIGFRSHIANFATSGNFLFANDGEQLLVYQGPEAAPRFVYGFNSRKGWTDATSSNNSALPPGLAAGSSAIQIPYTNCTVTSSALRQGTAQAIRSSFNNVSNWSGNNTTVVSWTTASLVITAGTSTENERSVLFVRSEWGGGNAKTLALGTSTCVDQQKITLQLRLDTGPDHVKPATLNTSVLIQATVTAPNVTSYSLSKTLNITLGQPEIWYVENLPSRFLNTNVRVTVQVGAPTTSGVDPTSQRVVVTAVPEYLTKFATVPVTVTPQAPAVGTGFEQTLQWTSTCSYIGNYQVQLVHKPVKVARTGPTTTDPAYDPAATPTEAQWNATGTLIETGSANLFYKLSLAEGDGTYHWRVRAVGNQPGGVTNPANWGPWAVGPAFAVQAPDAASNWIYSRSFSEEGHVAEKLTYANGLQQVRQTQTRLAAPAQSAAVLGQQVVAVQTVQDFAGRDAVTSLPIPIQGAAANALGFKPALLARTTGIPYEAEHFDAGAAAREPQSAVEQGYYSRTNDRVPDAGGYPFSRTVFSKDGTNRVIEQGGVGEALRVQASGAHTVRTSYTGVTPQEVLRLFGKEAPEVDGLYKVITMDPNNVGSVAYQTKDGKTIATAVAAAGVAGAALQDLPSANLTTAIKENITGRGQVISRLLTLTEPQEIKLTYAITPAALRNACASPAYCSSCDYQVFIRVIDVNAEPGADVVSNFAPLLVRAADLCPSGAFEHTNLPGLPLPAGTYRIEREVVPAEMYPVAANALAQGTTARTLAQHLDRLRTTLRQRAAAAPWATIEGYLTANNVAGLYTYLDGQNIAKEDHDGQLCYKIPVDGCDDYVYLPYLTDYCPAPIDWTNHGFSSRLLALLAQLNGQYAKNITESNVLAASPRYSYSAAQLDQLVTNMAAKTKVVNGVTQRAYPDEVLVNCWDGLLANVEAALYQPTGQPAGYKFEIVREFLQCAGVDLTTPVSSPGAYDNTLAYEQFLYNPNSTAHQQCILNVAVDAQTTPQSLPTLAMVLSQFSTYPPDKRNAVLQCLENADANASNGVGTPSDLTATEGQAQANMLMQIGREACENRRDEFRRVLVAQLHQQGQYVEGDQFQWVASTTGGLPTQTQIPLAVGTPLISSCEVESLVQDIVERCQSDCTLTPQHRDPTNDQSPVYAIGTSTENELVRRAMGSELHLYVRGTAQDNCPAAPPAPELPWQPVAKAMNGGTRLGLTSTTTELIAVIRNLTAVANRSTGTGPLGCPAEPELNTVSEKVRNVFSLSTSFSNWLHDPSCAVAGEPSYATVLDARTDRPVGNSTFAYQSDYVLLTDRRAAYNDACPPSAAALPAACDVLTDAINTTGHHYFVRFVDVVTQQPVVKAYIRSISEPYIVAGMQFGSGRGASYSSGVRVRLLVWDPGTNQQSWREADVGTFNENPPSVVADGDAVMSWKQVALACSPTTSTYALCYRWSAAPNGGVDPPTDPDQPVFNPTPEPCNVVAARRLLAAYQDEQARWIEAQVAAFTDQFQQHCVALATVQETFQLEYTLGYHHFTLYYYDRAGNLTKTVPPAGVVPLSTGQVDAMLTSARSTWPVPAHTLPTTYVYNSLHQLEKQSSPDGGETRFFYNRKGQLRFSQNARQRAAALPSYSYTRYDALGRVIEVGESSTNGTTDAELSEVVPYLEDMNFPPVDEVRQVTRTGYGDAFTISYRGQRQRYLTNRVAYSYYDVDGNPGSVADNTYTYYSYDPHGNVEWLEQEQAGLARKHVAYEYDLISNKVTKVLYQPGEADQFSHRYSYDADNRLTMVETSADGVVWDQDARYTYFAHGPLKRLELGEDHVQGVDYTYTLQGWLKGINHPSQDPGGDGTGTAQTASAKDAFGMALGYYTGDYTTDNAMWTSGASSVLQPQYSLYNGNIAAWTARNRDDVPNGTPSTPLMGEQYRYDQLNRLKSSAAVYPDAMSGAFTSNISNTSDYATRYVYDANGNLQTLTRNGTAAGGKQLAMDRLSYSYDATNGRNNRLLRVNDATTNQAYYDDFKFNISSVDQFGYDEIGNLTSDVTSGVSNIQWNVYGKIERVTQSSGTVFRYAYDAQGNRVRKTRVTNNGAQLQHTYYVRDAQGNVLAVYEQTETSGQTPPVATLTEQHLYGSSRLGVRRPVPITLAAGFYARSVTQKQYELTDHLGNVRAVVDDVKQHDPAVTGTYKPSLVAYYNYYPFGQLQPGRYAPGTPTLAGGYRYGYNGKEKDNNGELGLTTYDYGFRIYNPGLGRFLSVDPLTRSYPMLTPYQYASNTPIAAVDIDGKEGEDAAFRFVGYYMSAWLGYKSSKEVDELVRNDIKGTAMGTLVGTSALGLYAAGGAGGVFIQNNWVYLLYNPMFHNEVAAFVYGTVADDAWPIPTVGQEAAATLRFGFRNTRMAKVTGELIMEKGASFANKAERFLAMYLVREGKKVEVVRELAQTGVSGRTGDFLVDGVATELKSISGVTNTSSDGISKAIKDRLSSASGQAKNVILDLREQQGATYEAVERGVKRYFGQSAGNMQSVRVIGKGFDEVIPNAKATAPKN